MARTGYLLAGILFGLALTKGEAVSWLRIQEMGRLQGFQLYGIFFTSIAVSMVSLRILARRHARSLEGEPVAVVRKSYHHGNVIGGLIFGIALAITGACPGPLFAQLGSGLGLAGLMLLSALAGTWTYAWLRPRLPH